MRHQTKKMMPPNPDPRVAIDVEIAGLIRECWRLGLVTTCCCQGSPTELAYIGFEPGWHALLFVGAAGPHAWGDKEQRRRDRETPAREPWRWEYWRWTLEGKVVRFPHRDIRRAQAALERRGALIPERLGAAIGEAQPRESVPPRLCPVCRGLVLARRRDARYCSRACQLAARGQHRSRG